MSKKRYDDDDGRRIADMSGTGLSPYQSPIKRKKPGKPGDESGAPRPASAEPPLGKKEIWSLIINALGAALLIGLVFAGAAFIFILFCIFIWFR